MRWNREDTGEFQLGFFWRNSSIRWGVDRIFGMCTFSHEVELLFAIESILGEQGCVGIVRIWVSFNWDSFGEIIRLGGVNIVCLAYAHFHMKLNYFLPSSPYWASNVALES